MEGELINEIGNEFEILGPRYICSIFVLFVHLR